MPKRAKELTQRQVEALKADGSKNRRVMVGGDFCQGLHLRIEGGTKTWALRYKLGDRRRDVGLGPYNGKVGLTEKEAEALPGLSLKQAREKAREYRRLLEEGIDPIEQRRRDQAAKLVEQATTKTFRECAEGFMQSQRGKWANANAKHVKQWTATLETYAHPTLGKLPVDQITTDHVLKVLRQPIEPDALPLWEARNETATRLRARMERILGWATFRELRTGENPARWKGHLDNDLPAKSELRTVKHHASMPHGEVGEFMAKLRKREGMAARALEFVILTAGRSGEVRGARWSEIKDGVWTIPADRMKGKRQHEVPLSEAALALLEALPRMRGVDYVFPAPRGGQLSDMALSAVLKRMGHKKGVTVHGFRSTFRDWCAEHGVDRQLAEHALAHKLPDKVEAAYNRTTQFDRRVPLMTQWADYCGMIAQPGSNVVSIGGAQ